MSTLRAVRSLSAIATLVAVAAIAALPACDTADEGACDRIAEACHEKDTGSGKPHDCHESAEASTATEESCAALEADCLAACK